MTTVVTPRFKPGTRVQVKKGSPPGHFRTPSYVQGKTGRVEAVHGPYRNPEGLAYGGGGLPKQLLYRVAFFQREVWGERYAGPADDIIYVDLYHHWLEPVESRGGDNG